MLRAAERALRTWQPIRTGFLDPALREVAEATGGTFARIADADGMLAEFPSGRRVALHTDPPIPLWNTWAMLTLFGGLLLLEWIVRKTRSML